MNDGFGNQISLIIENVGKWTEKTILLHV